MRSSATLDDDCTCTAFRCAQCGGAAVQLLDWINPNTGKVIDGGEPFADGRNAEHCWCEDCDEHVVLVVK